ncbi:isochorismatase family protein [Pseudopedobacter sp.]|uniref:isochorismatase family protein n=1 Tax=Pseudopedobacter sp. TaxID=1936787 RepID=UPI00333E38EB
MDHTLLNWKKSALLVIDMQEDFAYPKGSAYIEGTQEIIPVTTKIVRIFRKYNLPVVHVVRLYYPDGSNADVCRKGILASGKNIVFPGTDGAKIISELLPESAVQPNSDKLLKGEIVQIGSDDWAMYKSRWGAFYETELQIWLNEKAIDSLFVIGCNFPNCPRTTIYEASERDYKIGIVPQAISGIYNKGIQELENIGVQLFNENQLDSFLENGVVLCDYKPEYQPYFERFNKAWLTKYYSVEPLDEYVLTKPEEAILKGGGHILFARYNRTIVGTVGLKNMGNGVMELTKMAVDESFHGIGAGKTLCKGAIEKARKLNASKLILYSQKRLATALGIYRKYGFQEIPMEAGKYKRADVMMELNL